MLLAALLLPMGILAGALTTVAGLGGGMLLLLAISLLAGPAEALAITAPALLAGNLHRLVVHRREVDRRVAVAFALGALPGSLAGGALALALPAAALQVLLLGATALAVARAFGLWSFRPPAAALTPAGFGIGAVAATTGGAGLLVSPLLLSAGLTGTTYIATGAAAGVAMHLGRIAAYGAGGLVTRASLLTSAALAAAILGGNLVGERARRHLDADLSRRIELGALCGCVALALAGIH